MKQTKAITKLSSLLFIHIFRYFVYKQTRCVRRRSRWVNKRAAHTRLRLHLTECIWRLPLTTWTYYVFSKCLQLITLNVIADTFTILLNLSHNNNNSNIFIYLLYIVYYKWWWLKFNPELKQEHVNKVFRLWNHVFYTYRSMFRGHVMSTITMGPVKGLKRGFFKKIQIFSFLKLK